MRFCQPRPCLENIERSLRDFYLDPNQSRLQSCAALPHFFSISSPSVSERPIFRKASHSLPFCAIRRERPGKFCLLRLRARESCEVNHCKDDQGCYPNHSGRDRDCDEAKKLSRVVLQFVRRHFTFSYLIFHGEQLSTAK